MIIKSSYTKLNNIKNIAILADPGCRSGWEKNFPGLLAKVRKLHKPDVFLVAGDMTLNSYKSEYDAILKYVNAKGYENEIWASIPGDHDRPLKNFTRYLGRTRKVIDIDKWRFIGINTSNRMFLKKEADWIKKHIRRNSIILSHLPPEAEGWTFHSLWPKSSNNFLRIVKKYRTSIKGMYFGHIHGFTRRKYLGIPMTVTGAVAESRKVSNNRYSGDGFFEMVIFRVKNGKTAICRN